MPQTSEPQHQGVITLDASPSAQTNGMSFLPKDKSEPITRQDTQVIQQRTAQTLPDDLIQAVMVPSHYESVVTDPPAQEKPMVDMIVPEVSPEMVTPLEQLTEKPTNIDCPHCQQRTLTLVVKEGSSMQTMAAAVCCLFCGVITVCIPMLCHWFEDTTILCSKCRKMVARIPHDGTIQVFGPNTPSQVPSKFPGKIERPA